MEKKCWLLLKDITKWYNHTKIQSDKQKELTSKKRIEIDQNNNCLGDYFNTLHADTLTMEMIPGSSSFENVVDTYIGEADGPERPRDHKASNKRKEKKNIEHNSLFRQELYKM